MRSNLAAVQHALESAGTEFVPENGGDAGVRLRRFRLGDLVRFRSQSNMRHSFDVGLEDIGTVVWVEPHPPQTGPTYRINVQFPRAHVEGVFKFEFELAKAAQGID
jgi:hypothetical protein